MKKEMRTPVIAGNWKMNKTPSEAVALVNELKANIKEHKAEVVICPPMLDIPVVISSLKDSNIGLGAQNCHFKEKGAYTGEVSVEMLKNSGCSYVIIGHSERRAYFNETDETVNLKIKASLEGGLTPILCAGETLEEREKGETENVIKNQIEKDLDGISKEDMPKVIVAYEPIWAIGTGKTATPEEAEEVCLFIRELLKEKYSEETSEKVRILYGGSMNENNAHDLLEKIDIDGGLIGGASLKPLAFSKIIETAESL